MTPSLIFIIPYRERVQQKIHFEIYMKYIMEDYDNEKYKIFFVHQCDKRPFNRGAMKNIGFHAIKKLYPNDYKNITIVFNDIDTIPTIKNIINFETNPGIVKHYYGFTFALGGIFSIRGSDFERTGGFPNFWGWGYEDNCMQKRVKEHKLKIDRSEFFPIGHHNILHILDGTKRMITKNDKEMSIKSTDNYNNIRNLNYDINNEMINVRSFETSISSNAHIYYEKDLLEHFDRRYNKKKNYFNMAINFSNNSNQSIQTPNLQASPQNVTYNNGNSNSNSNNLNILGTNNKKIKKYKMRV